MEIMETWIGMCFFGAAPAIDASRVRENWSSAAFTGGNNVRAAHARQAANAAGSWAVFAAAGWEAPGRAGTCAEMGLAAPARAVAGLSPVKVARPPFKTS